MATNILQLRKGTHRGTMKLIAMATQSLKCDGRKKYQTVNSVRRTIKPILHMEKMVQVFTQVCMVLRTKLNVYFGHLHW